MNIDLPFKCIPVLSSRSRYKVFHGGRAGTKSWDVARYLVVKAAYFPLRILCTREMQNSIKDSVYRLLVDQINLLSLTNLFEIRADGIRGIYSGSEFIFKGLHHNISEIKSTEGIDICWVEEAERVTQDSWDVLIPTIRKEDSEILVTFNPEDEQSATYKKFITNPSPEASVAELNYYDNPWFPEVLRKEMEYDKRVDPDKYEHVWLGKPKRYSEDLIFGKKVRIEDFETPAEIQLYYGADFGFSQDPTCFLRMFIADMRLWIDYGVYGVGVELDEMHQFAHQLPDMDKGWQIIADSQRPDTISFLSRPFTDKKGIQWPALSIIGAEKGKGSVEDGIAFLRGFEEIIIHQRVPEGIKQDFKNYRWKRDRVTDVILPIPLEGSDHAPDGTRYALEPYIKAKTTIYDIFGGGK